ncbi:hypothetical protein [Polaribacter gangjinensis]|uniref:hypothetical protein n=1 Tax=Polaribacter gangjinensis TaxID=574710 RepID=UPI0011B0F07D|nr:hypothetical protein [Polaribacter gangjinensis]
MKKYLLVVLCFFYFLQFQAQSNNEIASVYIKRANESLNNLDFSFAKEHFEKAMKYLDTINTSDVARLGTFIYFELKQYEEAKKYASYYFSLAKNKKSEEYTEMLTLSVDITEFLEKIAIEKKRQEEERIRQEKEYKRIDSLRLLWMTKSDMLSIKVDSIYQFNANNVAIYKKNDFFGLMNDLGKVLVEADEYEDIVSFDGYFIFKNKENEPTKLFCYNSKTSKGFLIPSISDFNTLATNYGKVMLPRGNGRLVTYPNNAKEPFVFDLNEQKTVKFLQVEEVLKSLKKSNFIDKYNNDGEVKIDKEWYLFGGHLGGGIHPIYSQEGYDLEGFLCSIDGRFLKKDSHFDFVGFFYNNSAQAVKGSQVFWINQNGTVLNETIDEDVDYQGKTKLTKLSNKNYQLLRDELIILGDEKLEKMEDFIKKSSEN